MWTALPLWAVSYGAGVGLGWLIGASLGQGLALLLLALLWIGAARWRRRAQGLALLAAALALGVLAQARALSRPPPAVLAEALLALRGEGESAPLAPLWAAGQIVGLPSSRGEGVALRVAIDAVAATPLGPAGQTPWRRIEPAALVALTVRGPLIEPLAPGDEILFYGALRPAALHQNPGDPPPALRMAIDQVDLAASVDAAALARRAEGPRRRPHDPRAIALALLRGVHQARERCDRALRAALLASDPADPQAQVRHALVSALLTGQRGPLAAADEARAAQGLPRISQVFRDAGIFHLLSVSGSHLAAFAFLFYEGLARLLLRCAPLSLWIPPRRIAAAAAIPAVLFYTALTGAEVATLRAAVVATVVFLAIACGRRGRLPEALALAALLLLHPAASPLSLFDPALQLSFAAALGVVLLRPGQHLLAILNPADDQPRAAGDRVSSLARRLLRLCQGSLGATLATAPLTAYHFGELSLGGVIGNLFAVPLAECLLIPAGLLGAALSGPWPAAGAWLLRLAGGVAEALLLLASEVAAWGLTLPLATPGPAPLLLFALGLALLALGRRAWPIPCALAALLCAAPRLLPPTHLTATFLDVGQADASVLELPGGAVVVIDGGEAPRGGEGPVATFLRRRGRRHIDLLIASHPHPDHIGGLPLLLARFSVGRLWSAGGAEPFVARGERPDPALAQALAIAARRGVLMTPPAPLALGGVLLTPLWPCASAACAIAPAADLRHNDSSLVVRVSFAGRALLFPGDLELPGELGLLEAQDAHPELLAADVLKAPHHCSRTSSSASFVNAVAPALVVCSLGFHNRYRFPNPEVLARYDALGTLILRTDRDGAVQVRIDAPADSRQGILRARSERSAAPLRPLSPARRAPAPAPR